MSLPPVRGTAAASTAAPAASTTASTKKSKSNDTQQQQNSTLATKIKNKLGIDISALTSFEVAMVIRNEKEKGNECFKAKEYQESVDFYSNAIDIDTCLTSTSDNASATSDLTLYTNRALAYCKLKSWDQALVDCSSVLAVDMNNIKAYWRRATAYTGKVMHDKAIQGKRTDNRTKTQNKNKSNRKRTHVCALVLLMCLYSLSLSFSLCSLCLSHFFLLCLSICFSFLFEYRFEVCSFSSSKQLSS